MLVLTRKAGETITVGDNVRITVVRVGSRVQLAIDAPPHVAIRRAELPPRETQQ